MSIRNLLDFNVPKPDWVNLRCNDLRCDQELFVTGDTTITGAFGANDINCNNLTAGANIQTDTLNTTGQAELNSLIVINNSRFDSPVNAEDGISINAGNLDVVAGDVSAVGFINPTGSAAGGPLTFNAQRYNGNFEMEGPYNVNQNTPWEAYRIGNIVTLKVSSFSANRDNDAICQCTAGTALPVGLRPSNDRFFVSSVEDIGAFEFGTVSVDVGGVFRVGVTASQENFSAGGDCGLGRASEITYLIN
jgi:hypothetical protein